MFYSFDPVHDQVKVFVGKLYSFARFDASVRYAGLAWINPDAIHGIIPELPFYSIMKTSAKSQEQDEHKNAPGYAESGKKSAKLILAYGVKYLFPLVEVKHCLKFKVSSPKFQVQPLFAPCSMPHAPRSLPYASSALCISDSGFIIRPSFK